MAMGNRFHTIVIGGAWNGYFFPADYTFDLPGETVLLNTPAGRKAALASLARRIAALVGAGKKVILLLDNPSSYKLNPRSRLVRLGVPARGFPPDEVTRIDPRQRALQAQLANLARRSGATVIDPFAAVCRGDFCEVTDATGRPLYRDTSHFNPAWAIDHASFIDATVAR
jgi:hypothetical protein